MTNKQKEQTSRRVTFSKIVPNAGIVAILTVLKRNKRKNHHLNHV